MAIPDGFLNILIELLRFLPLVIYESDILIPLYLLCLTYWSELSLLHGEKAEKLLKTLRSEILPICSDSEVEIVVYSQVSKIGTFLTHGAEVHQRHK